MCTPYRHSLFLLIALALLVPTLSGCDAVGEQHLDWHPGNDLAIIGPLTASNLETIAYDGFAPGAAAVYVKNFTIDQTYNWTVSPQPASAETFRDGEFFRINYEQPGTFTIAVSTTIEGQSYDDTLAVTIKAATAAGQIGRLPRFSLLSTFLSLSGFTVPDSAVTVLAPTNEALVAAFDTDADGTIEDTELPADDVLADILKTHVIPQTLTEEEITGGATFQTLGGGTVTFRGSGETLTAVVKNDAGQVIAEAPATLTGLPVADGALVELGGVLFPTSASMAS